MWGVCGRAGWGQGGGPYRGGRYGRGRGRACACYACALRISALPRVCRTGYSDSLCSPSGIRLVGGQPRRGGVRQHGRAHNEYCKRQHQHQQTECSDFHGPASIAIRTRVGGSGTGPPGRSGSKRALGPGCGGLAGRIALLWPMSSSPGFLYLGSLHERGGSEGQEASGESACHLDTGPYAVVAGRGVFLRLRLRLRLRPDLCLWGGNLVIFRHHDYILYSPQPAVHRP